MLPITTILVLFTLPSTLPFSCLEDLMVWMRDTKVFAMYVWFLRSPVTAQITFGSFRDLRRSLSVDSVVKGQTFDSFIVSRPALQTRVCSVNLRKRTCRMWSDWEPMYWRRK